jgi:hypothetical protein
MSPASRALPLLMIAAVTGCSSAGGTGLPGDAGVAHARPLDARTDVHRSMTTDSGDARSRDAHARDASFRDAGSRDAPPRDATTPDVSSVDATLGDAGRREAGLPDAVPGDTAGPDADAAPPTPASIAVMPLTLEPHFSPEVHDYYVRCPGTANRVTVAMTAAPGSTIGLLQPPGAPASSGASVTISVAENQAIVVGVNADGGTDSYWIRCLPHDFPLMQATLHPEAGAPTPGYYLVGNASLAPYGKGYAMAVDVHGVPVWYQATPDGCGPSDVDSVVPATISYDSGEDRFQLLDLDAGTTSYVVPSGIPLDLHELRYLPNGDYLVFGDPIRKDVNLTGLGSFGADEDVLGCVIQEVDPSGAAVWQWDAFDHFDPLKDTTFPVSAGTKNGVTVADVFHCNSIDVDADGNLLVSARHMDSVFLISRATGALLWKMGGAAYNKDGAPYITVVNDPLTAFYRQHDARLLPGGQLSMFDDQTGMPGPARAVIYAYDLTTLSATMVWEYQGPAPSGKMGSFRVESDGERVIGWGENEEPSLGFTELNANDIDVFDFYMPGGSASYRAIKIPVSEFSIDVLRESTGAN